MAVELVIKISDSFYHRLIDMNIDNDTCSFNESALVEAIQNGTQLPKGHGRLIDVDDLEVSTGIIDDWSERDFVYLDEIEDAPTIIEADKEDK